MSSVVGLDLSLTAPAACMLPVNWKPGDWTAVQVYHTNPTPPKHDDIRGQLYRYHRIAEWVWSVIPQSATVWIEGYAFHMNNSQASKLMELGGAVRMKLYNWGVVPKTVAASAARKLFFGNRKLPKANVKTAVQVALFTECLAPKTWTEDEADAFIVANYGLAMANGTPLVLE